MVVQRAGDDLVGRRDDRLHVSRVDGSPLGGFGGCRAFDEPESPDEPPAESQVGDGEVLDGTLG